MSEERERRAQPRVRAVYLLAYVESGERRGGEVVHIGRSLDLSEHGVQIESHTRLEAGQKLALEIAVGNRLFGAEGEIVHVEPRAEGLIAAGVRFTAIGRDDREILRQALA